MAKKQKGSKDVIEVDMKGSADGGGGGRIRVKEGDYKGKIVGAKYGQSKNKKTPGIILKVKLLDGPSKSAIGKTVTDWVYLTTSSLWRLRALLEALGIRVPESKIKVPLKKLVGKELGITLSDDEYETDGKTRVTSRISDFIDLETLAGDADLEEMDRDELIEYIEENDLDITVKKKWDEDKIRERIEETEEDAPDDDDDEDMEAVKKRSKKKKGKKKSKKSDDENDLEELDLDDLD